MCLPGNVNRKQGSKVDFTNERVSSFYTNIPKQYSDTVAITFSSLSFFLSFFFFFFFFFFLNLEFGNMWTMSSICIVILVIENGAVLLFFNMSTAARKTSVKGSLHDEHLSKTVLCKSMSSFAD